ncbi:hypothetical protein GRI42_04095 [Erythrobacter gaetbuli]|uniref:Phytoene synthase n=1 Tax=Qipengyuania gaetbuli TaxID=266952 RepID=A0A844XXY8_9SPHN|nr:squalene/phytoene synthase family protein [Qipengyuania gaetbuli]MXO50484.1 hypothetical protein [Qipengyuania gaetbuli]
MDGKELLNDNHLRPEYRIALAYAHPDDRLAYHAMFELDRRLAEIVAGSSEPMIGQLRLAWWRDVLGRQPEDRPSGEPLVAALNTAWGAHSDGLETLVDAWEGILLAERLERNAAMQFVEGRGASWTALASGPLAKESSAGISSAAQAWFLADLLSHLSDAEEREVVAGLANGMKLRSKRLPRRLRPFAILAALGSRALAAGGISPMEGRGAPLLALRIGIFGR